MFKYLIPVLLLSKGAISLHYDGFKQQKQSAASEAQIRFALENKYDDTGPGAKGPAYAYDTYQTLDDALVSYVNDPDTKLPEFEKSKGIQRLFKTQLYKDKLTYISKPYEQPIPALPYTDRNVLTNLNFHGLRPNVHFLSDERLPEWQRQRADALKVHKFQSVKSNPVNLAHFTKEPVLLDKTILLPNPNYSYSYGVNDHKTGDLKSAHEARNGGAVTGYYSFVDADGKLRTVHYTADDGHGFRAIVSRSNPHGH